MVCMRFVSLLILSGTLSLVSCATHYQQIKPDRIELYLKTKEAKEVEIAYCIDQFKPHPVQKISEGTWMATIPTTREFRYFYIIDGSVYLPDCPYKELDDFGSENCIFYPEM